MRNARLVEKTDGGRSSATPGMSGVVTTTGSPAAAGKLSSPLQHALRTGTKFFRSNCSKPGDLFRDQSRAFSRAYWLVKIYYAVLLFFPIALLPEWSGILERRTLIPLWPIAWLQWVDLRSGILAILILYLLGALLGAIFPAKRWARVLAFLGPFEFSAFENSFGKINHSMHLWVLTAFILIFLPRTQHQTSRDLRQRFLIIFWGCQAILLLAYSMSGLGKLLGGFYQLFTGQIHIFLPSAFSIVVAERLHQTNSVSLLGPWLMAHPWVGWPLMIVDLYLQLFSFWAAFRPALHRFWAIALILFHIGSYLFLAINFAPMALLVALLLLNSPFLRATDGWRQTLHDLPLFGIIFRRCVS
jgi:hypothetical protein